MKQKHETVFVKRMKQKTRNSFCKTYETKKYKTVFIKRMKQKVQNSFCKTHETKSTKQFLKNMK